MLIDFTVTNYQSFRDPTNFSMECTSDKSLRETNTIATGHKRHPYLNKTAVIYGANASGKSNFLNAIGFLMFLIYESHKFQVNQPIPKVSPFLLDESSLNSDIKINAKFLIDDRIFDYSVKLNQNFIREETMMVYENFKPQLWYRRTGDGINYKYEYGIHFKRGQQKLLDIWEKITIPNTLYLPKAVANGCEILKPFLINIEKVILTKLEIQKNMMKNIFGFYMQQQNKDFIKYLLKFADVGIKDFDIKQNSDNEIIIKFLHHANLNDNPIAFPLDAQSDGTQNFLLLSILINNILNTGGILIYDEMESSLHPLLVQRVIEMFHDPKINTKNAQCIFTTHNAGLLQNELFRRDQIWFTEKDNQGASHLYSLSDYNPRKDEDWQKGYLKGKFGAIPFFGDWPELLQRGLINHGQ